MNQERGMGGGVLTLVKTVLQRNRLGELLVLKGHLTPGQLRQALLHQKESALPLGRVLVHQRLVSRQALYRALGQQWALRLMAGVLTFAITFSSVNIKVARAGAVRDVPAMISLASTANAAFAPVDFYPALFGAGEKASNNLSAFTKWTGMFSRFERAMDTSEGQTVISRWRERLRPMAGLPLAAMAQRVNDLVNETEYINDSRNWSKSDYWETPVEFFTHGGDCEDFAIAKYVSLRALGVPEDRLRVALVHDKIKDIPHALLILYTDNGALVLDNQVDEVRDAARVARYRPIFSINRYSWWLHTAPSGTVVASAE